MKSYFILLLLLINSFIVVAQDSVTTIILVRHAEKVQDGTKNPTLTKDGILRSIQLAYMLRADSIAGVFSTNYERTIKTAEPTANFHDLPVLKYSPRNHEVFINNLLMQYRGKKVLVVGHSNTIPNIVQILTGKPQWQIKDYIYNDLFVVTVVNKGEGQLLHLKYGKMSEVPVISNVDSDNIGVKGYDVVAYFKDKKAIEGNKYISTTHKGVTYYFSSQKYLEVFQKNPEKYIPQFGGWCAYGFSMLATNGKTGKYDIDPESFKVIDGKLYLFYKVENYDALEYWNEYSDSKNLKKANTTWKMLKK
ncbi:MAG: YHS domain-containing (seleno)protein [Saprospiraceae bacterium]